MTTQKLSAPTTSFIPRVIHALPLSVVTGLLYGGLLAYAANQLRVLFGTIPAHSFPPIAFALRMSNDSGSRASWIACLFSVSMVFFLWTRWRARPRPRFETLAFLGTAIFLLAAHAIFTQALLDAPPLYELRRAFP